MGTDTQRRTARPTRTDPPAHRSASGSLRPFLIVWAGWVVLMAGANLATPLYAVYAQRFGFSSLVLTSVFATYAFVLVPALILFGRVSDRFGRRPVILAGLVVSGAGLVVFALAQNVAWLYGARVLQGLAVGMISGAATAALVELDPRGDKRRAALFAGLAQAGGSATGPMLAGALAQWAPAPLRLSFLVGLGATGAAAAATLELPDASRSKPEPWRIQVPRVPRQIRGRFARVSLTAGIVWATVALYLSIVPSYAGALLRTHDLSLLAAVSAIALVASALTQIISQGRSQSPAASQATGLGILAAGLLALVLAAPLHSLAVLVAGAIAAGLGHGLAFLNAQEEVNQIAPARHRGEVTAAFIACIYFLVASAVISTGLLDLRFSLSPSVAIVSVVLMASALAVAAWHVLDSRSTPSTCSSPPR
jgi:predicted MFS family arabinose efflux permease